MQRQYWRFSEIVDTFDVEHLLLLGTTFQCRINITGLNIQLYAAVKINNTFYIFYTNSFFVLVFIAAYTKELTYSRTSEILTKHIR